MWNYLKIQKYVSKCDEKWKIWRKFGAKRAHARGVACVWVRCGDSGGICCLWGPPIVCWPPKHRRAAPGCRRQVGQIDCCLAKAAEAVIIRREYGMLSSQSSKTTFRRFKVYHNYIATYSNHTEVRCSNHGVTISLEGTVTMMQSCSFRRSRHTLPGTVSTQNSGTANITLLGVVTMLLSGIVTVLQSDTVTRSVASAVTMSLAGTTTDF